MLDKNLLILVYFKVKVKNKTNEQRATAQIPATERERAQLLERPVQQLLQPRADRNHPAKMQRTVSEVTLTEIRPLEEISQNDLVLRQNRLEHRGTLSKGVLLGGQAHFPEAGWWRSLPRRLFLYKGANLKNNQRTYEHTLKSPSPLTVFEGIDIAQYVNPASSSAKSTFEVFKMSEKEFLQYRVGQPRV